MLPGALHLAKQKERQLQSGREFMARMVKSLSNDDGDGNENGKKTIGLDRQNSNFVRASLCLYISLPSLHDYNMKMPKFTFCRRREHKTTTFFFFS